MRFLRVRALGVLLLVLGVGESAFSRAPVQVRLREKLYVARVDIRKVFTPAVREKIESGLTTRIVIRASAADLADASVRSLSVVEYRILYRVWEEDYVINRWDALGETTFRVRNYERVLARVGQQRRLPFAGRDDLTSGRRYQAVVEVDIDPVSEELLERVREYLSNPGGHRREGGARGLFGNLARIFFDARAEPTQNAVEFRSDPFIAGIRIQ